MTLPPAIPICSKNSPYAFFPMCCCRAITETWEIRGERPHSRFPFRMPRVGNQEIRSMQTHAAYFIQRGRRCVFASLRPAPYDVKVEYAVILRLRAEASGARAVSPQRGK